MKLLHPWNLLRENLFPSKLSFAYGWKVYLYLIIFGNKKLILKISKLPCVCVCVQKCEIKNSFKYENYKILYIISIYIKTHQVLSLSLFFSPQLTETDNYRPLDLNIESFHQRYYRRQWWRGQLSSSRNTPKEKLSTLTRYQYSDYVGHWHAEIRYM